MKKSIKDFNLKDKKVIIRCDFNVPIANGTITDDNRIVASLNTIKYAINNNAKIILMSHLGKVKSEEDKQKNNLKIVATKLSQLLNQEVKFCEECIGSCLENMVNNLQNKEVLLIQNTRYMDFPDKKESKNDSELGKYWASLGEIFINDAFGTSHRAHASNVGIASYLESGIGFLIEEELSKLSLANDPIRPYVVIMGGAKISDKISLMENLALKADKILIGGAMANTFIKAKGYSIGKSLYEEDKIDFCKQLLLKYPDKLILPVDFNNGMDYNDQTIRRTSDVDMIRSNEMTLDIGPETIDLFIENLEDAKTIVMNGPLGVFEFDKFNIGTKKIIEYLERSRANVIIGGGDSAAAVLKFGNKNNFYHISTGGGASLEYLEGKVLPGIAVINEK